MCALNGKHDVAIGHDLGWQKRLLPVQLGGVIFLSKTLWLRAHPRFEDFQGYYKGSIPFAGSNFFPKTLHPHTTP